MNILFLSLGKYKSINERGIYTDLLRQFIANGDNVTILSALEEKLDKSSQIINEEKCKIIQVYTGKIQKTNIIEKGINTLLIETRYKNAIKKYCRSVCFDLVLYPTPPITLVGAVSYAKRRDNAKSYLLLKDIFPQNAVDIGMLSTKGIKGLIYKYFRNKEKKLYKISDYIGCMSQANVDYVLKHNPEISSEIVEICPNCIEVLDKSINDQARSNIREKYGIPLDKKVFVYGGNLGKPQGIDFLIKCMQSQKNNKDAYFLIVGDGTEYGKLEQFTKKYPQDNLKLMKRLPKEDYDTMVAACDVGMIFLDYRFTIPNFPSRLLSYMQAKIPVLACTDANTDIGDVVETNIFGWKCLSDDIDNFSSCVKKTSDSDLKKMGENGYNYLELNYNVENGYRIIMKHFREDAKKR